MLSYFHHSCATTTTLLGSRFLWSRAGAVVGGSSSISRSSNLLFHIEQQQQQQQHASQQQQQVREKHSSTQIKRLFRKNPARLRVEERMGIDRTPEPLPPPTLKPIFEPTFLQNGWSPPPSEQDILSQVSTYPFEVRRTKNKPNDAIGFLPVYSKFRKDGTKATTRIKKVTGDRDLFLSELRSVLQLPSPKNKNLDQIRIRTGGTIEVDGNRVRDVKQWLAGLGF